MTKPAPRAKAPLSKGYKALMLVLTIGLPLILGLALWFHVLDQNPLVSIPTPVMPAPNARDFYIAAANAVVDGDKVDDTPIAWNPGTKPDGDQHFYSLADKTKLVAENAGAIQTLHTGFRYPCWELQDWSIAALSPDAKIRGLARLLSLEAQVDAEKGDLGGAMTASLDAVQMGETLPRGGPLIWMAVGIPCQSIGRKQAWKVVGRLNGEQAQAAARRLETIRASHVPFADTVQEEEWADQAGLLQMMRRRDWPNGWVLIPPSEQHLHMSAWVRATRIRLAGKRTIMANYTRYMNQEIVNARQPYAAHRAPPPVPSDPINQSLLYSSYGDVFNRARINETVVAQLGLNG